MKILKHLILLLLIASTLPGRIWGQVNLGAIKGETQDAQRAAVPNVKITLRNEATGVVQTTSSNASGEFSLFNLSPGVYTLTAEAPGFSSTVQEHIVVSVGSTASVLVPLKVGAVQQSVVVAADLGGVQTETSDIGTAITPEEIRDLPLSLSGDMRNPLNFVLLTPGVAGSTPGATPDYRIHISGSVSYANEVYIDGVPVMNTNLAGDIGANHPPQDSISQFKLINSNQTAQYGLSSGIVSFAFNSGTNDYHGTLYDYLQNDALDATGYVTNAAYSNCLLTDTPENCRQTFKKAPLKQNEFGGNFGGPVRLPKLYNGRDKTFFFVDYTGFKYRPSSNNASLTTFPTPFRNGDFSAILGPQLTVNGSPVFDPDNRPVYQGEIYDPFSVHNVTGPDGKTYAVRDPFPGNMIPSGYPNLSKVSQTILQSFPMATNNAINDNFFRRQSQKIDEHRLVVKIDEHISDKHAISGSVFTGGYSRSNNGGLNLLDSVTNDAPTAQVRFTYNYTHSATLLNNANIGFIRDKGFTGPLQPGPGLEALGLKGLPPFRPDSPYPQIGIGTAQNSIGSGGASFDAENRYIVNDNLTMVRGHHTFTFGGETRWLQRNEGGLPAGGITFEPTESALNGTGFAGGQAVTIPAGTGHPAASFLFGGTDFVNISYPIESAYRWWQIGMFAQDDWKVLPNLTLNVGLRYDIQVPRSDAHGNVSTMDPTLPNPAAGGIPGAFTFYGNGSGRNGHSRIGEIDYKGVQPRIGLAWSPDAARKTSIRAGFAVTRPLGNDNLESAIGGGQYTTGFSGLAMLNRAQDYVGSPGYYWDGTYPSSAVAGASLDPGLLVGNDNPPMIHPSSGMPPTQFYWTTQFEHQFGSSVVASLGYVGMHTYHLGVWSKPNEVNPKMAQSKYGSVAQADGLPLNQFLALPISDPRVQAAGINAPWPGFEATFGPAATASQALRPWPQYGDVDNPLNPIASVSYNGLQSSLQKHFSHGLTALLSYTFSKTIGDADSNSGPLSGAENAIFAGSFYQDYYDPKSERAVTSSDIPHVVSLSYTYELPFGHNKSHLNHGPMSEIAGGWSVSGIHQYQSGRPIHIEYDAFGASNPYFAAGDGFSFRPNLVPGQPLKNPAYKRSCSGPLFAGQQRSPCQFYINPAAFSIPPSGEFGNAPNLISALRMPAFINEDLSVSKRTRIYERFDLQFQANFFNALNRTIFSSGGNAQTFIINSAPHDLSQSSLENSNTVFGIMTDQQNGPRIIQFGMKLEF